METFVSNNIQNHYWRESPKSLAIFKSHTESQKASCYWNNITSVDSNKTCSPLNFGGCPCVGCSECHPSTCLEGFGRRSTVILTILPTDSGTQKLVRGACSSEGTLAIVSSRAGLAREWRGSLKLTLTENRIKAAGYWVTNVPPGIKLGYKQCRQRGSRKILCYCGNHEYLRS